MTGPRPGAYDRSVYARGGHVQGGTPPGRPHPPAAHRGLPNQPRPARVAPTFMTVEEIAAELRVSKMTVYRAIHSGALAATRIGRSFRVTTVAVDEFIAAGGVQ